MMASAERYRTAGRSDDGLPADLEHPPVALNGKLLLNDAGDVAVTGLNDAGGMTAKR
jgi:hypothetical protein